MFLHLGQDVMVAERDIIGIFDLENTTISKTTREFLNTAQARGEVVNVLDDLPKSFILCQREGKRTVYISQISPATLEKRKNSMGNLVNPV